MHFGQLDRKAANIDAIQPQQGPLGGEAPARRMETAKRAAKCLNHPKAMGQQFISVVPPVVKVTGNDEGRIGIGNAFEVSGESIHLPAARTGEHREMNTDAMKRLGQAWRVNGAMQQTPPLEAQLGDVLIVRMLDRKTGEDRIAMVPVPIDHVASIGSGLPDILRQEFVLGLVGPVFVLVGIPAVPALDFLKKHNIWTKNPQLLPQLVHHQVLMEL